jgi:hypothetical protein
MKRASARKTVSSGNGRNGDHGRASRPTNVMKAPICLILSSSKDGAICPARGVGAALALPFADTEMMQLHIEEIALNVAKGAHAVLLLDRAGWHTTANLVWPRNITPLLLPSRSPELNPVDPSINSG